MATTSKKARSRIYWRNQGGERRAYADFRDFADVGGKREALVIVGAKTATTDPIIAEALVVDRLTMLQERRRNKTLLGIQRQALLAEFGAHHLVEKARSGRMTEQWLAAVEMHLEAAIQYFCNKGRSLPRLIGSEHPDLTNIQDRDLASITVQDLHCYTSWLSERSNGRDAKLSPSSQRKYLNSLSNLYRRAISEACVPPGYNPVQAMMDKPQDSRGRSEARWLEVPQAALLLEALQQSRDNETEQFIPPSMLHAIVATMLLTGGRPTEVLGLEVRDVNFDRKTVTFRPNQWRRLKTATSHRAVPMWPQLETILREWLRGPFVPPPTGLLFPSLVGPGMVRDIRKGLDAAAKRIGWKVGDIRPYAFRHTYCAARLQTLDRGHPISPWTVAREMGHGGRSLIDRVYGHLGEVRHRSDAVEFHVTHSHDSRIDVQCSEAVA